jgi:hypothetical protein
LFERLEITSLGDGSSVWDETRVIGGGKAVLAPFIVRHLARKVRDDCSWMHCEGADALRFPAPVQADRE